MREMVKVIKGIKRGRFFYGMFIFIAFAVYMLSRISRAKPHVLEKIYPASVNREMIRVMSLLTSWIPFSFGELFVYFHVLLFALAAVLLVLRVFRGKFFPLFFTTLSYIAFLYVVFMLVFGLNYYRGSVREVLSLERMNYGYEELYGLCTSLIEDANALRERVTETEEGVFTLGRTRKDVYLLAGEGFEKLGKVYPEYSGRYGRAKGILASEPMNHTGITGIFMPFTGEANVNTRGPELLFPATVLHEMAHQRGIAYENEANYMAYLVSGYHSEPSIRYSGTVLALISAMNAMYRENRDTYRALYDTYKEGLIRDLAAYSVFYKAYEGEVHKTATKVNDTYLKSNGQASGVKSYGEMVDLLLEHHVQKGTMIRR